MTTICTICARGGSVGVPRKNIRSVGGKPLIGWTIEQALAAPEITEVHVSTEDDEIARIAEDFGANVPYRRPEQLATSAAGKLAVIQHLVDHLESTGTRADRVIDLDPTSPLRNLDDISGAAALLDDATDVVITAYASDKNPYFNMVERQPNGDITLVKPSDAKSRQAAPTVYAMNASIYVWHRHTLAQGLWDGRTRLYEMPQSRSIDIDSEIDLRLVELLLSERGLT